MEIIDYISKGGRNLIFDSIIQLDKKTRDKIIFIRNSIEYNGHFAFENIEYIKLFHKVYEIKVFDYRIAYTIYKDKIYFLHLFRKQKNKTEKKELKTIMSRFKEIMKGD